MTDRTINFAQLAQQIKHWGMELGFEQVAITDTDVSQADARLQKWLDRQFHGTQSYMERNRELRRAPDLLVPGTIRIISVRLNYLPDNPSFTKTLSNRLKAYVSRYALGRDYHKVIRKKLTRLAKRIENEVGELGYRAFTDSAPVFERHLAQKAGIGWIGKNTLILNRQAGSFFFLGELFTNLPLPVDSPVKEHCGNCTACIDVCPTKAIVAPYQLDSRRCISYLTIENKGSIPLEFREAMGNRIYGCDDCQIICPWNKFAKQHTEPDFAPRHQLNDSTLVRLFQWTEQQFLKNTEGMAIRRATYIGWLRNIAVALGNAPSSPEIINALKEKQHHPNALVQEHIAWALQKHQSSGNKPQ